MRLLATSTLALGALLAALAAGCSRSEPEAAPDACLDGPDAYLAALGTAREGRVELAGGVPISDCLVPAQGAGELADVGAAMVTAATRLGAETRGARGDEAAFELGYLIGAATRGASDTAGIHTDLIRRLDAATGFGESGARAAASERAFGRGYADGLASG